MWSKLVCPSSMKHLRKCIEITGFPPQRHKNAVFQGLFALNTLIETSLYTKIGSLSSLSHSPETKEVKAEKRLVTRQNRRKRALSYTDITEGWSKYHHVTWQMGSSMPEWGGQRPRDLRGLPRSQRWCCYWSAGWGCGAGAWGGRAQNWPRPLWSTRWPPGRVLEEIWVAEKTPGSHDCVLLCDGQVNCQCSISAWPGFWFNWIADLLKLWTNL